MIWKRSGGSTRGEEQRYFARTRAGASRARKKLAGVMDRRCTTGAARARARAPPGAGCRRAARAGLSRAAATPRRRRPRCRRGANRAGGPLPARPATAGAPSSSNAAQHGSGSARARARAAEEAVAGASEHDREQQLGLVRHRDEHEQVAERRGPRTARSRRPRPRGAVASARGHAARRGGARSRPRRAGELGEHREQERAGAPAELAARVERPRLEQGHDAPRAGGVARHLKPYMCMSIDHAAAANVRAARREPAARARTRARARASPRGSRCAAAAAACRRRPSSPCRWGSARLALREKWSTHTPRRAKNEFGAQAIFSRVGLWLGEPLRAALLALSPERSQRCARRSSARRSRGAARSREER